MVVISYEKRDGLQCRINNYALAIVKPPALKQRTIKYYCRIARIVTLPLGFVVILGDSGAASQDYAKNIASPQLAAPGSRKMGFVFWENFTSPPTQIVTFSVFPKAAAE